MTVREAEARDAWRSPAPGTAATSSGAQGRLWASARTRLGTGSSLKEAVRCICSDCGAHSYRAIGMNGGGGQCSLCDSYDLQPLEAALLATSLD